jgi:hypothetical protein
MRDYISNNFSQRFWEVNLNKMMKLLDNFSGQIKQLP